MYNKTLPSRYRLFLGIFGAEALLLVILRTVAFFTAFDPAIGYFSKGALSTIIYIAEALMLLDAFAPFLLFKKEELSPEHKPAGALVLAASAAVAALLAVTACYLPLRAVALINALGMVTAPSTLMLLATVLALPAAAHFFLPVLGKPQKATIFGYAVIPVAILLLSATYFDLHVQMNAPHKVSIHLALLSIMVFMLYEIRAAIGRGQPRAWLCASSICFLLSAAAGIPNLIAFAAGKLSDPLYLLCDLLALAIAFYVAAKTVSNTPREIANSKEDEQ